jgi:hypothetical protein
MTDPRVDAYIEQAQPFARPILKRLRTLVHRACPDVRETMKWSFPHFDYKGMYCSMAAFKAHCSFGFWKHGLLARQGLVPADRDGMGSFGRFTSTAAMPSDAAFVRVLGAAKALNDAGVRVARPRPKPKPPLRVPPYVRAAVRKRKGAAAAFDVLTPSHRREYVEWVVDAKTAETRERRLGKMVAQLVKGQSLNAKYNTRP